MDHLSIKVQIGGRPELVVWAIGPAQSPEVRCGQVLKIKLYRVEFFLA